MSATGRSFSRSGLWASLGGRGASASAQQPGSPPLSPRRASLNRHAVQQLEASGLSHEDACVAQLKRMLSDAGLQLPPECVVAGDVDATLRRFLRARKFRLDAAYDMLRKHLAWRRSVGADDVLRVAMPPKLIRLIRECRPSSYIGFHRDGWPIFVERLGMLDAERIEREQLSIESLLTYHQQASRRAGRTVDRVITIMDAAGLTLSMLTGFAQRLFRALTAMDSDNYPETCHKIYIVNNSAAFTAIWRAVRVFVDQGTRDKVHVLGSGDPMLAALLAEFDAAQIPSFLGGTLDYDERRRQWLEAMDIAMAEAAARAKAPAAADEKAAAAVNGGGSYTNGIALQLPGAAARVAGSAASQASEEADGWATPLSAASRASNVSALSVYFDAMDAPSAHSLGRISSGAAAAAGGGAAAAAAALAGSTCSISPCASPRSASGKGGAGLSPFDATMPAYVPQHQHHALHTPSKLAAVPSGDLGEGPQPRCCAIS